MSVRVNDERCLTPSLPTSGTRTTRRVAGMLEAGSGGGGPRLVREVRYDGRSCRYRLDEAGPHDRDGRWVEEGGASYRPFCHLILERLSVGVRERTFRLHRLPGTPPSRTLTRRAYRHGEPDELVALDSCLTVDGGLWVEVAIGGEGGERGWLPLATLGELTRRLS